MKSTWTDAEKEWVELNAPSMTMRQIRKGLEKKGSKHSRQSICSFFRTHGITYLKDSGVHRWTGSETDYLLEYYGRISPKEMAEHLGLHVTKVYQRADWMKRTGRLSGNARLQRITPWSETLHELMIIADRLEEEGHRVEIRSKLCVAIYTEGKVVR